jgi:hypothetical protein
MARIVKLSQLLPEDVVFELPDGSRVKAPGDAPLSLVLRIATLFQRVQDEQEGTGSVSLDALQELDSAVLELLRLRQPDLERSPFGVLGVCAFVGELLGTYETQASVDPTPARSRTRSRPGRTSA